ncbi:MAG: F0F1 ATP synthase subunit B [Clostridiales bacterium]|nr:F0F1 ATP synthase subunit B [Clostridiales bacterium]
MNSLDIISVNIWQTVISLLNLVILFLIVKKLLFKPVKKMIAEREEKAAAVLKDAEDSKARALETEAQWDARMKSAEDDAGKIIKEAKQTADRRSEKILRGAKERADDIVRQAKADAELERARSEDEMRHEIIDLSSILTKKMLRREINEDDHKELIDDFIQEISDIS